MRFSFLQNNNFNTVKSKGFTLLEVLIAIAILSFAIATTFTATQTGLSSSIESKNQVISYFLGQEAVEFIRNKRDENSLMQRNWLYGIAENSSSDPCFPGKVCDVDVVYATINTCPTPSTCPNLKQDTSQGSVSYGMYGYGVGPSWVSSNFKREISIVSINSDEIAILINITWVRGSYSKTVTIRESLFNWQ